MARILLTHPYHLALDERESRLGRPYPPLSTLNAATLLQTQGHQVELEDRSFHADESDFGEVLDRRKPELLGIMGDDHSVQMKQCIGRIRQAQLQMLGAGVERGIPVLVSGPDVSDHPEIYLEAGATAAVVGEALEVVGEWAAGTCAPEGRDQIQGLHGSAGSGGRRAPILDLDRLPDTDWSLVDHTAYADRWRSRHGYWELNISTARGCPYTCNWCAKPTWGRSYAVRSAARVAQEIDRLRGSLAPDRIWFTDDIFAIKPEWLRQFRAELKHPIPYRCLSRADLLEDPAYAEDLRATGCWEVWIGAESGSDEILRAMDKGSKVAEIERARDNLRARGIGVGFFLQLGYPGEGLEEVNATIDLVRRLRPEQIGVSVSYPLPGTVFHDRVAHSMVDTHWEQAMDNRPLFQAPFTGEFYAAAKEVLRSTHSVGQARVNLRELIQTRDPRSARRVLGSAWHAIRLPLFRRRMKSLAQPNPSAVSLSW
jgi:anaerobic magnesium-protoporphyrin IX monomethyl ester cyclase